MVYIPSVLELVGIIGVVGVVVTLEAWWPQVPYDHNTTCPPYRAQ